MSVTTRDEHDANHEAQRQKRDIGKSRQLGKDHPDHSEAAPSAESVTI
jgi:hypothetical protein